MAHGNGDHLKRLFRVRAISPKSTSIHLNFVSDPGQEISIRLPQYMIELADETPLLSEAQQSLDVVMNRKNMRASIAAYLTDMYGDNMPEIYMAPYGRDLVMDIYIHHEHSDTLKKLSNKRSCKVCFLKLVLNTVQQRVLDSVNNVSNLCTISGPFLIFYRAKRLRKGDIANKTKICSILLNKGIFREPGRDPIKVGDNLLTFGWKDIHLRRSAYFNVVITTKPESIRWPQALIDRGSGPNDSQLAINKLYLLLAYVKECLHTYHDRYGLTVHLAKNNTDLIFTIPVHINDASALKLCFSHPAVTLSFSSCVFDHCRYHIWASADQLLSLEPNSMVQEIDRDLQHQPTFGEATEDEINSLMLLEKDCQPRDGLYLDFYTDMPYWWPRYWQTDSDDEEIL